MTTDSEPQAVSRTPLAVASNKERNGETSSACPDGPNRFLSFTPGFSPVIRDDQMHETVLTVSPSSPIS